MLFEFAFYVSCLWWYCFVVPISLILEVQWLVSFIKENMRNISWAFLDVKWMLTEQVGSGIGTGDADSNWNGLGQSRTFLPHCVTSRSCWSWQNKFPAGIHVLYFWAANLFTPSIMLNKKREVIVINLFLGFWDMKYGLLL